MKKDELQNRVAFLENTLDQINQLVSYEDLFVKDVAASLCGVIGFLSSSEYLEAGRMCNIAESEFEKINKNME